MSTPPADRGLSLRSLYALFLPLALSGAFFPVARPIINAALARTDDAEAALAAYSVAAAVTMPLVAPLFGMRQIVTALCVDAEMIRRLGRVVLTLGSLSTAVVLLLSIPSIYLTVTDAVLGIPADIARLGQPAMWLLATAPLLMIGRAHYQGVLVHFGHAGPIGLGSFGYLLGCTVTVFAAVLWWQLPGAVAAAASLMAGNLVYLLIVWPPTRPMRRAGADGTPPRIPARDDGFDPARRSTRSILTLYHPLALSTLLTSGVEPVVQMAMARLDQVTESLAAYAVCVSIVWLARTNLWNTQQVVIARVRGNHSYRAVRRWVLSLSLGTTALMAVVLLPPVSQWVFGDLIGLDGPVRTFAAHGYAILLIVPFLQGWRSLYYGTLVTLGSTGGIRTAALARIVVLLVALGAGVWHGAWAGIYVAAVATLLAELTEVAALQVATRRVLAGAAADR